MRHGVVFLVVFIAVAIIAVPVSYHIYSFSNVRTRQKTQLPSVPENKTLTVSPLIGPKLILNIDAPNDINLDMQYISMTVQVFGSDFMGSQVYCLLNTSVPHNGNYTFLINSTFYNISMSYVRGGFGDNGASLNAVALYNTKDGGQAGYNNIDFFPEQVHIARMRVSGNMTFLNEYFENTGFDFQQYGVVQFVNVTLYCDL
ncbi:hypothetical protein DMB44_03230 [Thermoplasma sp. Kam2015]|uniref:hypothetical protein n=1 Tax=Thermoplasma sp. Kam2015 TaxID=2094122 RepID=UPI000D932A7E|nr:hypothetical protein [Thermoplasma sp. Kam2015]PYB68632.1 hypothetical protein DMB44_03230 [Thermoplasma sp. Kam2015]